jgi:hypothetical protein
LVDISSISKGDRLMSWLKKYYSFRVALFLLLLVFCGCASGPKVLEQIPPWKFAVISDTQGNKDTDSQKPFINEKVLTIIADDIVREHPDVVLVSGDLVNGWLHNGGTDYAAQFAAWKEIMKPVYDAGIEVYPIRGNHEDGPERLALSPLPANLEPPAGSQAALKDAFQKAFNQSCIPLNGPEGEKGLTYSFSHKNALIIGLDEYSVSQHKINQAWFEAQIAGNKEAHLFVYGHEPAFGVSHKDNLSFFPEDRDKFWNAIGKGNGRVYFCGHDHMYNRAAIADSSGNVIRQIVVGTGGGSQRKWSGQYLEDNRVKGEYSKDNVYSYALVTIDGPRATMQWKTINGEQTNNDWQALDAFSYDLSEIKSVR